MTTERIIVLVIVAIAVVMLLRGFRPKKRKDCDRGDCNGCNGCG